jgi:archaellum biogenesis protein FlaJ (TadC family)
VPWISFLILVALVVALSLVVTFLLAGSKPWLIAVLVALGLFLWNLPRLVSLQAISNGWKLSEGPGSPAPADDKWPETGEVWQEQLRLCRWIGLLLLVALLVALAVMAVRRWVGW